MEPIVTCLPGIEPLLVQELQSLGLTVRASAMGSGAVQIDRSMAAAVRVATHSALASQVLWRCAGFRCRSLGELHRKAAAMPWGEWLRAGVPVCLRVHARRSRLYHTGAIAQRVADAIREVVGCAVVPAPKGDIASAGPDDPVPVHVRFDQDRCTLSVDLTGVPLHRRGYRTEPGSAPLREDLAAALLLASGWQPGQALLDPMCGAGTLLIEAARQCAGIGPGAGRPMAWQRTALAEVPGLEPEPEIRLRQPAAEPLLVGSDRDHRQLERAQRNAERAGVAGWIRWDQALLRRAPWLVDPSTAPAGIHVVTHPPFGLRSGRAATLRELHQTLGNLVRGLPEPWRIALVVQDRKLAYATGIQVQSAFLTRQAGHSVHAMVGAAAHGVEG